MTAEIILRKDALAIGRVRYFTGTPCKNGHVAERLVSDKQCLECKRCLRKTEAYREWVRKWNAQKPDRYRESARRWDAQNREKKRNSCRKWQLLNPEKSREASRRWRIKNPEKYKEAQRKRYAKNPEKFGEAARKWAAENPERRKEVRRKWFAKNPGKIRQYNSVHNALRRSRILGADGSYTHEQILDLFKKQKGKCAACFCSIKASYHIDHIMALSKGGSNDITNIQLLCQPCNNQKHAKDPIVWAQQNGRLL